MQTKVLAFVATLLYFPVLLYNMMFQYRLDKSYSYGLINTLLYLARNILTFIPGSHQINFLIHAKFIINLAQY